jgi:rubrerythrin
MTVADKIPDIRDIKRALNNAANALEEAIYAAEAETANHSEARDLLKRVAAEKMGGWFDFDVIPEAGGYWDEADRG